MISVIIPTLNAAGRLGDCLAALVPAAADGLVTEVVIADGGSSDATPEIADAMGATLIAAPRGRANQMIAGAASAKRGAWLLFLHADTVLETGWEGAARGFIERSGSRSRAAAFALAFDDESQAARRIEKLAAWRAARLGLPYGDQGLLISRAFYDALGGFHLMPLMEDVDLVRRIGAKSLSILRSKAVTSADKYRRDGWNRRTWRNVFLVIGFYLGVAPERLARWYQ